MGVVPPTGPRPTCAETHRTMRRSALSAPEFLAVFSLSARLEPLKKRFRFSFSALFFASMIRRSTPERTLLRQSVYFCKIHFSANSVFYSNPVFSDERRTNEFAIRPNMHKMICSLIRVGPPWNSRRGGLEADAIESPEAKAPRSGPALPYGLDPGTNHTARR